MPYVPVTPYSLNGSSPMRCPVNVQLKRRGFPRDSLGFLQDSIVPRGSLALEIPTGALGIPGESTLPYGFLSGFLGIP